MDISYDPRCSIYKKRASYYITYYLPNKIRVQSYLHKNQRVAKRMMRQKENELLIGKFDEKDVKKMPELQFDSVKREELSTGVDKYLAATRAFKKPKVHRDDSYALRSLISRMDKQFVDQVGLYDIQMVISNLVDERKSQSTIKGYRSILHKFFEWIADSGIVDMTNPVSKKAVIPKFGSLFRDRLPTDEEIQLLISYVCGIQRLIRFLVWTGCRLGEALHLEWGDIDQGTWVIKEKPNCPTRFGMGWSPKWGKPRKIYLFPEAQAVLEETPKNSRWVFPKRDGTRQDFISKSWGTLKKRNGISDLQVKDLRNWFNHKLKSHYGFTTKEASAYLGHSPEVNEYHYDPISEDVIQKKLNALTVTQLLPRESVKA